MDWTKQVKEAFNLFDYPAKYYFFGSLLSGLLLFLPKETLFLLAIDKLQIAIKPYLGIFFLASSSFLIIKIAWEPIEWLINKYKNWRLVKSLRKRLKDLTVDEKRILCGYVLGNTKTQYLSIQDGVVLGLEQQKIIYRSSNLGDLHGKGFSFNIQTWAWEYLSNNKGLITEGIPKDSKGRIQAYKNPFDIVSKYFDKDLW